MRLYPHLVWPLLARLDPERAHEAALGLLEATGRSRAGRLLLRAIAGRVPRRPVEVFGLTFPNPLGVAAGFDKDVRAAVGLAALGFGHVEVGTLTPRPQPGNPRPRLFRLPRERALVNRLGFPNRGVEAALPRLVALGPRRERGFVVGVSLGKQKETPLARAAEDYEAVLGAVYPHADYLAVNVSSPNTPGLRELQGEAYLADLLARLAAAGRTRASELGIAERPLLVKVAPDLEAAELDAVVAAAGAAGEGAVSGWIATNTTSGRPGVDPERLPEAARSSGGLSGAPLAPLARRIAAALAERTALPVVAAGGIATAADARARLATGASLVQVYTGLVYEGPGMAGRLLRGL